MRHHDAIQRIAARQMEPQSYRSGAFLVTSTPLPSTPVTPEMEDDWIVLSQKHGNRIFVNGEFDRLLNLYRNPLFRFFRRVQRAITGSPCPEPNAVFGNLGDDVVDPRKAA